MASWDFGFELRLQLRLQLPSPAMIILENWVKWINDDNLWKDHEELHESNDTKSSSPCVLLPHYGFWINKRVNISAPPPPLPLPFSSVINYKLNHDRETLFSRVYTRFFFGLKKTYLLWTQPSVCFTSNINPCVNYVKSSVWN